MPTIDDVDAALERLNEAKASGDVAAIKAASRELNDVRQQWKLKEIEKGRRMAPNTGDNSGDDAVVAPATVDTSSTTH